jgi:hypothetical protein
VILKVIHGKKECHHPAQAQIDGFHGVVIVFERTAHLKDPDEVQHSASNHDKDKWNKEGKRGLLAICIHSDGSKQDNDGHYLSYQRSRQKSDAFAFAIDFFNKARFNEEPDNLKNATEETY